MSKYFLTDCDEVLLNWFAGLTDYLNKYYPGTKLDISQYSLGLPKEFSEKVVDEFNTSVEFESIPPLRDAVEYAKKITDLGYKFVAITTCLGDDNTRRMRENNLYDIFGKDAFHEVHCLKIGTSKLHTLQQYEPTFWVDDKLKHCESGVKAGHKSFQMIHEYNENDKRPPYIPAVKTWKEIYEYILSNPR